MAVKRIDHAGWYEYEGTGTILCGKCVQTDLDRTAKGEYTGSLAVTLDMVEELSLDEGAYQCDGCLDQSENYDDESEN